MPKIGLLIVVTMYTDMKSALMIQDLRIQQSEDVARSLSFAFRAVLKVVRSRKREAQASHYILRLQRSYRCA